MIKLYKFGQIGDVCDPSPFCAKVEAYLRLAGLNYESVSDVQNLRKAPKSKLPYIEDNGKIIPDSGFILDYLKATYGDSVDGHLNIVEKAIVHAFIRMIAESLCWVLLHARWKLEHNVATLNKLFFGNIPFPLNRGIAFKVRNDVLKALYKQGIGRHSDAEVFEIGNQDLRALSDLLSDKLYFFGDRPTTLDAAAYGILSQMILVSEFTAPIFNKAKSYNNLVAFTHRFHEQYFHTDNRNL
jgi:glutathione S-transferase